LRLLATLIARYSSPHNAPDDEAPQFGRDDCDREGSKQWLARDNSDHCDSERTK